MLRIMTTKRLLRRKSNLFPMRLVEGVRGVTKHLKFVYRAHDVRQTLRSYDVRNKTHRGYDWFVTIRGIERPAYNRAHAKQMIDQVMNAYFPFAINAASAVKLPNETASTNT